MYTSLCRSGEASPTIWSCYANFKSLSLFISLEFDCFYSLWTQKYLHSMTTEIVGLAQWALYHIWSRTFRYFSINRKWSQKWRYFYVQCQISNVVFSCAVSHFKWKGAQKDWTSNSAIFGFTFWTWGLQIYIELTGLASSLLCPYMEVNRQNKLPFYNLIGQEMLRVLSVSHGCCLTKLKSVKLT